MVVNSVAVRWSILSGFWQQHIVWWASQKAASKFGSFTELARTHYPLPPSFDVKQVDKGEISIRRTRTKLTFQALTFPSGRRIIRSDKGLTIET